jgi:hypothetical protein
MSDWMPGEKNWGAFYTLIGMISVGLGTLVYMTVKDVK